MANFADQPACLRLPVTVGATVLGLDCRLLATSGACVAELAAGAAAVLRLT